MAFPTGWNRKCALTISSSMVSSGSLSDFPVLLTQATLPSEMFDSDGSYPAQSDGGDIRFSSDSAGSTQLACEVVEITTDANPANGTATIWVKVPSVTASGNTTIYVWYNTAGTTSKEGDATTYGRDAVWAGYNFVSHDGVTDSSGNETITASGTTSAAGPFGGTGNAREFNGTSDYLEHPCTNAYPYIASAWIKPDSVTSTGERTIGSIHGFVRYCGFYHNDAEVGAVTWASGTAGRAESTTSPLSAGTWALVHGDNVSATERHIYADGALEASSTTNRSGTFSVWRWGSNTYQGGFFDGVMAEMRLRTSEPSSPSDWYSAEHNNQSAPATYITAGTPADGGGGGGISVPTAWHHFRNLHAA